MSINPGLTIKPLALIIFFAFLYPIRAISDYSLTISNLDIVEWKTYIILITLFILSIIAVYIFIERYYTIINVLSEDPTLLKEIKCYRCMRHNLHLPTNGQRTCTNNKTQKRLSPSRK